MSSLNVGKRAYRMKGASFLLAVSLIHRFAYTECIRHDASEFRLRTKNV